MRRNTNFYKNSKKICKERKEYYKEKKEDVLKLITKSEFEEIDVTVTKHFYERYIERIESDISKFDLTIKFKKNLKYLINLSDDIYLLGNVMCVCRADKKNQNQNGVVFITCLGDIDENFQIYNVIISEGAYGLRKFQKKYGKMDLQI